MDSYDKEMQKLKRRFNWAAKARKLLKRFPIDYGRDGQRELAAAIAKALESAFDARPRFSGCFPSNTLPCERCGEVAPTAVGEVWCNADPRGRLVRWCENCTGGCAGG